MYVCICNKVTDHQIRHAVHQGASSLKEISAELGVASCCGKCKQCAREVIEDALEQEHTVMMAPIALGSPA